MSDSSTQTSPSALLVIAALLIVALRGFLYYSIALRRSGDLSYAIGYSTAQAILAPAVFGGVLCIPKKGRNSRRFTIGFTAVSALMLVVDIGQLGQSARG